MWEYGVTAKLSPTFLNPKIEPILLLWLKSKLTRAGIWILTFCPPEPLILISL